MADNLASRMGRAGVAAEWCDEVRELEHRLAVCQVDAAQRLAEREAAIVLLAGGIPHDHHETLRVVLTDRCPRRADAAARTVR